MGFWRGFWNVCVYHVLALCNGYAWGVDSAHATWEPHYSSFSFAPAAYPSPYFRGALFLFWRQFLLFSLSWRSCLQWSWVICIAMKPATAWARCIHYAHSFIHIYVYMYMYICSMCGIMCSMCGFIFNLIKMGEWHAFGHATVLQGPPVGSPSGGPFPQLTYTLC